MPTPNEIRDLVEQDRFELMMRCPFYGRIICSVELVVVSDPQVRMACTDYSRIFISGDAYSALPEEKRLAVLAHEVLLHECWSSRHWGSQYLLPLSRSVSSPACAKGLVCLWS